MLSPQNSAHAQNKTWFKNQEKTVLVGVMKNVKSVVDDWMVTTTVQAHEFL